MGNKNIDWNSKFDAIYCIHYLPFKQRVPRITDELKRVGILDSRNFKWKYTFDSPFYTNLLHSDIRLFHDTLRKPSMLKCTLAHYDVYKEAEGLGLNRILVIEDDVVFLKDIDYIRTSLDTMPTDCNVVQFDYWTFSRQHYEYFTKNLRLNDRYAEFSASLSSGALYSLDSKAIRFAIERQESALHAGDTAWHEETPNDGLKRCFCIRNLGYQKPYDDSYTSSTYGKSTMNMFYGNIGLNEDDYV